jgi:2-oxoglutarate ferredoxin oxidoreductase subunit alpha
MFISKLNESIIYFFVILLFMRLVWRIGGQAGTGINNAGLSFARVLMHAGYHVFMNTELPSLIRGGHNIATVRVEDKKIGSPINGVDLLVALDQNTADLYKNESKNIVFGEGVKAEGFFIPMQGIVDEVGGDKIMRNTVALGFSIGLIGLEFDLLKKVIEDDFNRKGEKILKEDLECAKKGFDLSLKLKFRLKLDVFNPEKRILISGNHAITFGALKAGCKFFSAYPMTPASPIMDYLAPLEREFGIVMKQTEDEIAAVNMAIGASFSGARSMAFTSGGGFSLMVEGLGLSGITENPVVIAEVQRPGPSTGLPTRTGQEDLKFILSASQGEFPRIVVAPGDCKELFEETVRVFNLTEKYQVPGIIISDKFLGESFVDCEFPETSLKNERSWFKGSKNDFKRYAVTENGVSPRSIPGGDFVFRCNSDEHDEEGYFNETVENRVKMTEKRWRKVQFIKKELKKPEFLNNGGDLTLVGFGSTKNVLLEAVEALKGKVNVNFLHVLYLSPFQEEVVKILESAGTVVCVENNFTGQLASVLRENGFDVDYNLLKFDGRPFTVDEVVERVLKLRG